MTIALQLPDEFHNNQAQEYATRVALQIVAAHPHSTLYIIVKDSQSFLEAKSISEKIILIPSISSGYFGKYFYRLKLKKMLSKLKVDCFISQGDAIVEHPATKNIVLINNPALLLDKRVLKNIMASHAVIASSSFLSNSITEIIKNAAPKVFSVPYPYDSSVMEISLQQRANIQKWMSDENEYFMLFQGGAPKENVIMALKGFSIFKKWQQSNIQLLIIVDESSEASLIKILSTYKFKDDVKIIPQKTYDKKWIGASYASIVLSSEEIPVGEMHQVIEAKVPLLVSDNSYFRSAFGNAACYFNMDDDSIAQQLILLYKNESYRNEIISQARILTSNLHHPPVIEIFQEAIKDN